MVPWLAQILALGSTISRDPPNLRAFTLAVWDSVFPSNTQIFRLTGHFAVLEHSIDQAAADSHCGTVIDLDLITIENCLLSPEFQQIASYLASHNMIGDEQCYCRC